MKRSTRIAWSLLSQGALGLCLVSSSSAATATFRQGVDGYTGMLDIVIGSDIGAGDSNALGSDPANDEIFLDGRYRDVSNVADEKQYLVRFDSIFGNGPGQIPMGSKIVDAKFYIASGETSGNAQSGGPFGVAELLVPFDTTTTFNSMSALGGGIGGATFAGGTIARPMDRGFRGPILRTNADTGIVLNESNVTSAVQNWSNGSTNNGLAVIAGTADGWQIITSSVYLPEARPMLEVTYDPAPQPASTTVTYQQNVNGYAGTTMIQMNEDDTTNDGAFLDEAFLDGETPIFGNGGDNQTLIKFNNIFASQGGSVPDGATILDAQLVIDTGRPLFSQDSGTNGSFSAHQMLVDWDLTSVYSDYGVDGAGVPDGPSREDNEIGPVLDITGALIADARASFDISQAVRNWQNGAPNYGIDVKALNTDDGWAINFTGSFDSPPQLQITYADAGVSIESADADFDSDVDGVDFITWQRNFGSEGPVTYADGDADDSSAVDGDDLSVWKAQYGVAASTPAASAVPEPSALVMTLATSLAMFGARGARRR